MRVPSALELVQIEKLAASNQRGVTAATTANSGSRTRVDSLTHRAYSACAPLDTHFFEKRNGTVDTQEGFGVGWKGLNRKRPHRKAA